jgi:hypothetical protein
VRTEIEEVAEFLEILEVADSADRNDPCKQMGLHLVMSPRRGLSQSKRGPASTTLSVRGASTTGRTWPTTINGYIHHIHIG